MEYLTPFYWLGDFYVRRKDERVVAQIHEIEKNKVGKKLIFFSAVAYPNEYLGLFADRDFAAVAIEKYLLSV